MWYFRGHVFINFARPRFQSLVKLTRWRFKDYSRQTNEFVDDNTALLWQKEASDIPPKSELSKFLYVIPSVLFFQAKFYAQTLILMLGKTSWYSIDISGNDRHILLFYKKWHVCHLLPFAKFLGQNNYRRRCMPIPNVLRLKQSLDICDDYVSMSWFEMKWK